MARICYFSIFYLFVSFSIICGISSSSPLNAYEHEPLRRTDLLQQAGIFSVIGAASLGDGSVHPRLEVRELEKNPDQWNIFLLGLKRFQEVDMSDKLSYYQIAGIHGMPYIPWDGVNQGPSGSGGGYCPHGSNLFATWHRPYLVLVEELIWLYARQVASEFINASLRDKYTTALATLRLPYWDWAAVPPDGQGSMPWSVQKPTQDVVFTNGTTGTIPNPLFAYTFPTSGTDLGGPPFSIWPTTLRDPSSTDANAASRNNLVALELDNNRKNLQSRVFNLLAMQHDYSVASNDLQPGDSFESIHDTIHNTVGSEGHMSYLAVAAFDPIFWLHHANVDRLFAIWQALNPSSYVTPMSNPYATFTETAGSVGNASTPLTPFHRSDSGTFWTSDSIRDTKTFGYSYPELLAAGTGNGNDTSALTGTVNKLYGPDATHQKRSLTSSSLELELDRRTIAGAPSFSGQRQYVTNIRVKKFSGIGSFNIYVFLAPSTSSSELGTSSKDWIKSTPFLGVTGMLSQPMQADNPKADVEANGAVPLTAALEQKVRTGELKSMGEHDVSAYLNNNLQWRIATMKGSLIPTDSAPGFQISVLWARVTPAASATEFPKMVGGYEVLVNATDGLPGGFARGDRLSAWGFGG